MAVIAVAPVGGSVGEGRTFGGWLAFSGEKRMLFYGGVLSGCEGD